MRFRTDLGQMHPDPDLYCEIQNGVAGFTDTAPVRKNLNISECREKIQMMERKSMTTNSWAMIHERKHSFKKLSSSS
jgi:hypothetical protein